MDIEGAEVGALKSATALLSEFKPIVLMSTHGEKIKHQCEQILKDLGYKLEATDDRDFIARHPEKRSDSRHINQ